MSNTNKFMAGFSPTSAGAYLHIISIAQQLVSGNTNVVVTYLGANGENSYVPGIASRTNVLDYKPVPPSATTRVAIGRTRARPILSQWRETGPAPSPA